MTVLSSVYPVMLSPDHAMAQPVISCGQPITFGRVVKCAGNGEIAVEPGGVAVTDGCIVPLDTPQPAQCVLSMTAPPTRTVQLSVTNTQTNLSLGSDTIRLDQYNINTKSAGNIVTYTPLALTNATETIKIGGRLTVPAAQTTGRYTGSVTVSVTFP